MISYNAKTRSQAFTANCCMMTAV